MTISGIITRAAKGVALTFQELDGNFTAIKTAIEAWALRFENGSRRTVAFSLEQPDDTGVLWGKLNSSGAFVGMYWYNGTAWTEMYQRTSWVGVDSSTAANAVVLTFDGLVALAAGQFVYWQNLIANTGPATAAINGAPAIPIQNPDGSPLSSGGLKAGYSVICVYSGTSLRVVNPPVPDTVSRRWVSADVGVVSATIAHTLGVVPMTWSAQLVCTVAADGHSIGDVIDAGDYMANEAGSDTARPAIKLTWSATQVVVTLAVAGVDDYSYTAKGGAGGQVDNPNMANWRIRIIAFA